jgi:hypothetical protein
MIYYFSRQQRPNPATSGRVFRRFGLADVDLVAAELKRPPVVQRRSAVDDDRPQRKECSGNGEAASFGLSGVEKNS